MKIKGSLLAAPMLIWAAPTTAQQIPMKTWTLPAPVISIGYCQLTGVATATPLSSCSGGIPTAPAGTLAPILALVQPTANANWRDDGTSPTSTTGRQLSSNSILTLTTNPMSAFRIIPTTGSMTVNVMFYAVR
jgi:hypothetical protein